MTPLNLPQTPLNLSRLDGQLYVFCPVRKKKLMLTPEEWVRQHIIGYLINEVGFSIGKIASEFSLKYNNMSRRADIVVMNEEPNPYIIIECKRPTVAISQSTFHQVAEYKHILSAKILVLSNGLEHYVIDLETGETFDDIAKLTAL